MLRTLAMLTTTVQPRSNPAAAAAVIEGVFSGCPGSSQQAYIDFVVGDITYLASRHNDRWGITFYEKDWVVRLNVGWVECLVLYSGGLRVLVDREIAPAHTKFDGVTYKLAPGCEMTTIPLSNVSAELPALEESHYAALSSAAKRKSPPHIRNAHAVGVPAFLSQVVRCRVPNPSYVPQIDPPTWIGLDEAAPQKTYSEGARVAVLVNRFERDSGAREDCITYHGVQCSVCGMSFGERYGNAVRDLIHVHHLVPLSAIGGEYQVDPINDLRPVCPNCHAVIHHAEPPLTIEQARALLSDFRR